MDADTLKAWLRPLPDEQKQDISDWLKGEGGRPPEDDEVRACLEGMPACVQETVAFWLYRRMEPEVAPPSEENVPEPGSDDADAVAGPDTGAESGS